MNKAFKIILPIIFSVILFQAWGNLGNGKGKTPSAGELVFKKYHCNACHGDKGVGVGDLRNAWLKYNDEQLRAYISNPAVYNNVKMPAFANIINEQDWTVLIEYVRQLGKEGTQGAK